jgi:hypothetical protein
MVGSLFFERPVSRETAQHSLVAFVRGFRDTIGSPLDAFGLDADEYDGIHLHLAWAGHAVTRKEQAAIKELWPHGLCVLSHRRSTSAADDWVSWEQMMKGSQSWSKAGSRHVSI